MFQRNFLPPASGSELGTTGAFETSVTIPQYTVSIPRESILHVTTLSHYRLLICEQEERGRWTIVAFLQRYDCCDPSDQLARKCECEKFT